MPLLKLGILTLKKTIQTAHFELMPLLKFGESTPGAILIHAGALENPSVLQLKPLLTTTKNYLRTTT
jgi:hypothetical protein